MQDGAYQDQGLLQMLWELRRLIWPISQSPGRDIHSFKQPIIQYLPIAYCVPVAVQGAEVMQFFPHETYKVRQERQAMNK